METSFELHYPKCISRYPKTEAAVSYGSDNEHRARQRTPMLIAVLEFLVLYVVKLSIFPKLVVSNQLVANRLVTTRHRLREHQVSVFTESRASGSEFFPEFLTLGHLAIVLGILVRAPEPARDF
jgi:hypothetical protein